MNLGWMINMIMLAFCSIQDIKEKEVSLWKLKIYGFLSLAVCLWDILTIEKDTFSLIEKSLLGLIPGLFLLFIAKVTKEAIGYGDGLILLIIGISLGFWESLGVLFTGLLGVFLTSVLFFFCCGRKKGFRIPFIPFLFTGMAGGYFWLEK